MRFDFLISTERSGSNLITQLLNAHPLICAPSPSHMIRIFFHNIANYGDLNNESNWRMLLSDIELFMNYQLGEWKAVFDPLNGLPKIKERSLESIIKACYELECSLSHKKRIFVKENHTWQFVPYLLKAFPEAHFIHLVRDPRDVVTSFKYSGVHSPEVTQSVGVWKQDQQGVLDLLKNIPSFRDRILTVRYEDLIKNTFNELSKICSFLKVKYSSDMLNFHATSYAKTNSSRIKAWENLSKPLISTNAGNFHTSLTNLELRYVEASCHLLMKRWGYECVTNIDAWVPKDEYDLIHWYAQQPIIPIQLTDVEKEIRKKRSEIVATISSRRGIV